MNKEQLGLPWHGRDEMAYTKEGRIASVTPVEIPEHAALILTACNNFHELVEALKKIASGGYRYPHEIAQAALEKLGGEG